MSADNSQVESYDSGIRRTNFVKKMSQKTSPWPLFGAASFMPNLVTFEYRFVKIKHLLLIVVHLLIYCYLFLYKDYIFVKFLNPEVVY